MRGGRQTSSIRGARFALAGALLLLFASAPIPAAGAPPLSPRATRAIEALLREKALRTPAQRKLASRLIHAERMRRGVPIAEGVDRLASDVEPDAAGRVLVDLTAEVSSAVLARIESLGGTVISSYARFDAIRALVPLARLEALAEEPGIRRIRPAEHAFTRAQNVSEGDGAHRADVARASFGVDGSGVTVGVISDGVDALASVVASGDLPADITILPGQAGLGSEGTAMLEIVHDLAPGASLLFATAYGGQAAFANNILALRAAGADVIVDDIGYLSEAVFQDDEVASAVDQVRADGALYFAAAGNAGNQDDGTAGVWEGNFQAGPSFQGGIAHDYGGGDITNDIVVPSPLFFTLHWSDPLAASANDYDLFLTDPSGTTVLAASTDTQDGTGDPFEQLGSIASDTGRQLIVVRDPASADRYLHLNANRGRLGRTTAGQTSGHAAARGAIGVAAVDARGHTSGFTGTEPVAPFSSDGPRRVFFEAGGTPITPGDYSSTGGELRAKPDLAGATCVSTATPGLGVFCGTSAAAPHLAAIAALLIDLAGGPETADVAAIADALTDAALDIEAPGADRNSGAGVVDALASAGLVAPPLCMNDPQCDDGLYCNGAEVCSQGACASGAPPLCAAPTPFCDESADTCVECLVDTDCGAGQCLGNVCTGVPGVPASGAIGRIALLILLAAIAGASGIPRRGHDLGA